MFITLDINVLSPVQATGLRHWKAQRKTVSCPRRGRCVSLL